MNIFAAASLADALTDIGKRFETQTGTKVVFSFGPSNRLSWQIEAGAPCDVFVPADVEQLDRLSKVNKLSAGSHRVLAENSLVVIAHGQAAPWKSLRQILQDTKGAIAVASPDHAPAGRYARQALTRAGLWETLVPRMRFAEDVRFAARYVAERATEYGLVYRTDAIAFERDVSIVYSFSSAKHDRILYEAATLPGASAHAGDFLEFAASADCRDIWRRHGFHAGE